MPAAVTRARRHGAVLDALGDIYRGVDGQVQRAGLICFGGGVCCRFDIADHRLYVTTVELAYLLTEGPVAGSVPAGRCPYQSGARCVARPVRPLGCRAYFCRAERPEIAQRLYRQAHHRIQLLHNEFGIPYHYVELTAAPAGL